MVYLILSMLLMSQRFMASRINLLMMGIKRDNQSFPADIPAPQPGGGGGGALDARRFLKIAGSSV